MNIHPSHPFKEVLAASFSKKGNGLGTIQDSSRLVEVPFAIPGDRVLVTLGRKRGGVYLSRLQDIVESSPLRIAPRCIHFGICGGCRWQQMDYAQQLVLKQQSIETLFHPLADRETNLYPIVACEPHWNYRNKMEFTFSGDASGNRYLGLIMDSSRGKVLNLSECHLVNPWFVDALIAVRGWWEEEEVLPYHPAANRGTLRTLTVREGMATGDRMVMLTVSGKAEDALHGKQLDHFVSVLRHAVSPPSPGSRLSVFLRIQQTVKGMETQFYEMHLDGPDHIRERLTIQPYLDAEPINMSFTISPSAFFQPNTRQAQKLYSLGLQMLDIDKQSVVYDLYCGTGTLGLCAAKVVKEVIGIELVPEAALDARANAAANRLDNATIFIGAVRDVLLQLLKNGEVAPPDAVMVDPPRAGLDAETIAHLAALKPPKILYISCNPATQAEDIRHLISHGYRLTALQPVDQFPHTIHIENIALLNRY